MESDQWIRVSAELGVKMFPSLDTMQDSDLKKLLLIEKPDDIAHIDNFHWWLDDHEECYGMRINGANVGFWWTDPVLKGMFHAKNKRVIFKALQEEIDRCEDDWMGAGEKIKNIKKDIEHIKSLKPETQQHFGGILKEL